MKDTGGQNSSLLPLSGFCSVLVLSLRVEGFRSRLGILGFLVLSMVGVLFCNDTESKYTALNSVSDALDSNFSNNKISTQRYLLA